MDSKTLEEFRKAMEELCSISKKYGFPSHSRLEEVTWKLKITQTPASFSFELVVLDTIINDMIDFVDELDKQPNENFQETQVRLSQIDNMVLSLYMD